jgi:D-2-hydroxyacid dehydrogenase (NADP+)
MGLTVDPATPHIRHKDQPTEETRMSILLLLDVPPTMRAQYLDGMQSAFPDQLFHLADKVADVDPFLADAEILVTHGPYMGKRADHMFANMPKLRWIQGIGVGVDNIVDRPTLDPRVRVTNMQGVHGPQMAEMALMAMLALSRQFTRTVQNKQAHRWERWSARLLDGKVLGILGVGSIAAAVAPRCKAMGMTVVGISGTVRDVPGFDRIHPTAELCEMVGKLDYLLVLTPYTPQTRHLVNAQVLAAMKPTAYFLNLARGGVLDEVAMLEVLRDRRIAGAALDVFETEPLPADHPFWDLDNLIITCHQGSVHEGSALQNLPTIIENIGHYLSGAFDSMRNIILPGALTR